MAYTSRRALDETVPNELAWPAVPDVDVAVPNEKRRKWGELSFEQRYKLQHESILRIVRQLTEERGFDGTQISAVVALAGVSRRTFYEHFETKDACYAELLLRMGVTCIRRFIEVCEERIADGPYETFLGIITAWAELISGGRPLARPVSTDLLSHARSDPNGPLGAANAMIVDLQVEVLVVACKRLGSQLDDEHLHLVVRQQFLGLIGVIEPSDGRGPQASHRSLAASLCSSLGFPNAAPGHEVGTA